MNSSKILAVVGTDTEVGKTRVTAALLELLLKHFAGTDKSIFALKPVESGCEEGTPPHDAALLQRTLVAHGVDCKLEDVNFHNYEPAVTPSLAARLSGEALEQECLLDQIQAAVKHHDLTLLETVGGALSPLGDSFSYLDIIARLDAKVLLVAGSKLGMLNHALLSLEVLGRRNIQTVGVVVNEAAAGIEGQEQARKSNFAELQFAVASISAAAPDDYAKIPFVFLPYCESEAAFVSQVQQSGLVKHLIDYYRPEF